MSNQKRNLLNLTESKQIGGQKAGRQGYQPGNHAAVVQVRHDEDLGQDHGEGLTQHNRNKGMDTKLW